MVVGLACSEGLVYNMWAVELNGCQTCHQLSETYIGPCWNAPHNITEWHWWPAQHSMICSLKASIEIARQPYGKPLLNADVPREEPAGSVSMSFFEKKILPF